MEDTFKKLKQDGQNTVDNLVRWMKDSKIATEEKARRLLSDVKDKQDVELSRFQQALSALAAEEKSTVEKLTSDLASEQGAKFLSAVAAAASAAAGAAASAFKEAMDKK